MYLQTNQLTRNNTSLSGFAIDYSRYTDLFWKTLNVDSYESGRLTLVNRCNWNYGKGCFGFGIVANPFSDCFSTKEIEVVINTYGNLVLAGKIPEYPSSNPQNKVSYQVEKATSDASGVSFKRVQFILQNLYDGTKDGTIKCFSMLYPLKAKEYEAAGQRTPPNSANSEGEKAGDFFATWLKYGTYVIYGALGLGALYVGSQAYGLYKTLK